MAGRVAYTGGIVRNGLVLHLDAAKRDSYPKTGTVWTDLSGNRNNGTLTNGPTYNSSNGGNIVFDGTNQYVDFYVNNLTTTTTIEIWTKLGSAYSGKMLFGWFYYSLWCGDGHLGFNTGNGDVLGINSTTVTNLGLVNNWKHYIFEMRSDVSYTNNKIYINGALQSLSQVRPAGFGENTSRRNFNNGTGRLSSWSADTNYCIPMNCSIFKIYNRALSATEVLQNYNALKGRYI